jgi:hypothetical protein
MAVAALIVATALADEKVVYQADFENAAAGAMPDDILVLDGAFAVKEEGGNKFVELPGAPLETYGFLFGPVEPSGIAASARISGTGRGRRFPTFGVGLNGVGGYRLQVSPAKKMLELYKGDIVKASQAYEWPSGKWVRLKIQIRGGDTGPFRVEGTVWIDGEKEPVDPNLGFDETELHPAGKPSVWGSPFAGTPIRFDDLRVSAVSAKP